MKQNRIKFNDFYINQSTIFRFKTYAALIINHSQYKVEANLTQIQMIRIFNASKQNENQVK